jgi:benzoyl-CoA reductase/2-hydroxyglutaryl-CoA dehydratase subunit BcrC/BadD/HgdB
MTPTGPDIQSLRLLREMNVNYYNEVREAARQGKPVGYVDVFAPAELLSAMDVIPIYPENHAVFLQARKMTADMVAAAEKRGYPRGLCSYALCDMGSTFTGISPVGGLPKPDFFLTTNAQCSPLTKWFERMSDHFDVPLFLIDVPFTGGRSDNAHCKEFVRVQIMEFIEFLEDLTGKPLDPGRLRQIIEMSNKTTALWKEIIESAAHVPSPISVFDQFFGMAPIVAQRGTRVALEFYQQLKAEIDDRVVRGIGAVAEERYRLYWDSLPLWHEMKWLSGLLASFGACLVSTIYTRPWADFHLDPDDPVSSWVDEYVHYFDWHLNRRVDLVLQLTNRFHLNGFIFHCDRSCKMFSTAIFEIRRIVQEKTGVPAYIFEGDHGDPRFYSKEQIEKGLTTYFHLLEERR